MESAIGRFLLTRLPKVRRRKDEELSVLAGLLDALGTVLDAAKDGVQSLRRRGFVWQQDAGHGYYADSLRGQDLDRHALDRGTRRLAAETDEHLRERLQVMPHVRLHMGSALGMRHLVESVLGHSLASLVVYCDDPQGRIQLAAWEQGLHAETDVSHVFSAADQADVDNDVFRQNRLYSEADLDYRFQFWISIAPSEEIDADEMDRIVELINQEKPAHTVARVHFVET